MRKRSEMLDDWHVHVYKDTAEMCIPVHLDFFKEIGSVLYCCGSYLTCQGRLTQRHKATNFPALPTFSDSGSHHFLLATSLSE